ncbi:MAG TPA: FAD:protein FMN transferase [Candidatus Paceibacterota bacterium]|nr:FAD:protein FMN transferase [Candidatus Paceibacterota bacterium]
MTSSGVAHLRSEIEVWGTTLFVDASSGRVDESSLQEGMDALGKFVLHVDDLFSTYKDDSVISQLRRKEIQIEETTAEVRDVWDRCIEVRDLTDGAFDPWAVEGGFDPSGLVKGWAADKCAQILQGAGAEHIQINAAGDLSLRGGFFDGKQTKPWSIGVVNPENRQEVVQVFEIMDGAIATSGTYERGAHILDPHSGLIAIGARSATVLGPDAALADALATALMVEGRDGAIWFSQPELAQYSAWVVDRHDDIAWSVGPESLKP